MTKVQIVLFSVVHTLSVLLVPLLIFLLGGCMEPELVNKPGPEIPCADIEKALNDSAPGPWTFEVGEFLHKVTTAAPVNQPPSKLSDFTQLVLAATPYPTPTPKPGETAGHPIWKLRVEQTLEDEKGKNTEAGDIYVPGIFSFCASDAKETYHNLVVVQSTMPVPVADGETCDPKFPGCVMNVTKLNFDKLVTVENGEKLPVHALVITSNQVPYATRILEECYTYPLETNGTRIPVTRCNSVENFKFRSN